MKKIAIIIGHSQRKKGAINEHFGITEFDFNKPLGELLALKLKMEGYSAEVIYRKTLRSLPSQVNATGADIAISLHCNAFNKDTTGAEALYYRGSMNGKLLADCMVDKASPVMQENNRGTKPIDYSHVGRSGDKGGYLVKKTSMPCVIVEPFFIDFNDSLFRAANEIDALASAMVKAVNEYFFYCK